jgi:hypothetical protein
MGKGAPSHGGASSHKSAAVDIPQTEVFFARTSLSHDGVEIFGERPRPHAAHAHMHADRRARPIELALLRAWSFNTLRVGVWAGSCTGHPQTELITARFVLLTLSHDASLSFC